MGYVCIPRERDIYIITTSEVYNEMIIIGYNYDRIYEAKKYQYIRKLSE